MIRQQIKDSIAVKEAILNSDEHIKTIEDIIEMVYSCLSNGSKVLIAGNGGSAADAQHFAGELVCTFMDRDRKGYSAMALTTDTSIITAWSNDVGYDAVFERQVQAHGRDGDVLVVISTSGNSKNLIRAIDEAKKLNLKTITLLGKGGGGTKGLADIDLIVPSDNTPRIQDAHTTLIHVICEEVENKLVADEKKS